MITSSSQRTGVPLTENEQRAWSDIEWLEGNAEVQAKYVGQWVVVRNGAVVASDADRDACLERAMQAAGCPAEELTIWPVPEAAGMISKPVDEPHV